MELTSTMDKQQLQKKLPILEERLRKYKDMDLCLNMARGKPSTAQLDLSNGFISSTTSLLSKTGIDYRNYGILDGIPEAKELFAAILDISTKEIIIGGNSSLTLMYDIITTNMLLGASETALPWSKKEKVTFLCPSPGYDRHFAICEQLGIHMLPIPMDENGPKMDIVEEYVSKDDSIVGIWCVPKYSNPTGITYADDVVKRLASMETAAKDFRIFWDNAYILHDSSNETDPLLPILEECKKANHPDRVYMFTSTSKITYSGAGIAVIGASEGNIAYLNKIRSIQMICTNKVNQKLHVDFLKDLEGVTSHMKRHATLLRPKFQLIDSCFTKYLSEKNIAKWTHPNGGYFINLEVLDGCAKEIIDLAKEHGVTLTPAGATYPYRNDPKDNNIRIAPSYPELDELETAAKILCTCIEYVSAKKLLR